MKFTKRILGVLLMAAILVSCALFAVSAEDTFTVEGIDEIEDILEFYELPSFVSDDYEDGTWSTDYCEEDKIVSVVDDPAGASNKVLFLDILKNSEQKSKYGTQKSSVSYETLSDTPYMIATCDFYYDSVTKGSLSVVLKTVNDDGSESSNREMITFTMSADTPAVIKNNVWNSQTGAFVSEEYVNSEISVTPGNWYKFAVMFDAEQKVYSFKISDDGGESWVESEEMSLGNIASITSLRVKAQRSGTKMTAAVYLDNIDIYSGTFIRDLADKNNATAKTILDLEALYNLNSTDLDTKVRIAEVLNKLVNTYEFEPASETPDLSAVEEAIENSNTYIAYAFANVFISKVNAINPEDTYYPRLEWVNGIAPYDAKLPIDGEIRDFPGMTPELADGVIAAREKYRAEISACEQIAEDSAKFISEMFNYDSSSKNYDDYMKPLYDTVSGCTMRDATYADAVEDVTDFVMADAIERYNEFEAKYLKLDAAAKTVIDSVEDMVTAKAAMEGFEPGEEQYEVAWAELYNGYFAAIEIYGNGNIDENLDNDTHVVLKTAIDFLLENQTAITSDIEKCENFLEIMKRAKAATYYDATLACLAEAEEAINEARAKYPGVEDAKDLYTALISATSGAKSASEAYVNSVAQIDLATDFAGKKAAVDAALILQAEGNVLGVEGVKEANIALSKAASEIEALINNSEALIAFVEQFKDATEFSERRLILANAKQAAENSEATYKGVKAAKAELESQIKSFENEIKAANDAHANAVSNAFKLAGAVVPDAKVYKSAGVVDDFVN